VTEAMHPSFSVVVPAFNAASTVTSTVTSVLRQTRNDFEVVVVDDGSSDDTAARVEEIRGGDARVRLIRQPNAGVAEARNAGIAASAGRYVTFLDSDDILLPRYLELVGTGLEAAPSAGMACADAWILDDKTRRVYRVTMMGLHSPPRPLPADPEELFLLLLRANFVPSAVTLRRSVLEKVGSFDRRFTPAEDWELWLRIVASGYSIADVPGRLVIYRDRTTSLSSDLRVLQDAVCRVYDTVLAEYTLSPIARARAQEAQQAAQEQLLKLRRRPQPSPLRRALSSAKQSLLWRRRFHASVPETIAEVFPDLKAL
jgi:glycosyltransferase involved in cell wall biosynthesis